MPPRRKLTPKGYTPSPWMARRLEAAQAQPVRITKISVNGKQIWPRLVDAPVKDLGDTPRFVRQYGPEISFTPTQGAFVLSANIPPSDAAPVGETTRESLTHIKAERAAKQAHEDALNAPLTLGALIALLSPQSEDAPPPPPEAQPLQAALRQSLRAAVKDLTRRGVL